MVPVRFIAEEMAMMSNGTENKTITISSSVRGAVNLTYMFIYK